MRQYGMRKDRKSTEGCAEAGWGFLPFIVSAYGRPAPEATSLVRRLCVKGAREYVAQVSPRLRTI